MSLQKCQHFYYISLKYNGAINDVYVMANFLRSISTVVRNG